MYILKLKPVFKDYIWGGTKLRDEYGFQSDLEKLAEGWMLSCHKDGENLIENGDFEGSITSKITPDGGARTNTFSSKVESSAIKKADLILENIYKIKSLIPPKTKEKKMKRDELELLNNAKNLLKEEMANISFTTSAV